VGKLIRDQAQWEALVIQHSPRIHERIHETYKRWNQPIRDCLRAETGLRMNIGEDIQAVPVSVAGGLPVRFGQVLTQCDGIERLLLNRPKIENTRGGLQLLLQGPDIFGIEEFLTGSGLPPSKIASDDEIKKCRDTLDTLLKIIDQQDFAKSIFGIDEDVLGVYTPYRPSIRLMWLPIAIVSANMGIAPEALTVVVLTHELAHAYTHVGRDIDGNQWHTDDMVKCELGIVEGLAQYYTKAVCARISARFPQPL
jgi:hypothetical protein